MKRILITLFLVVTAITTAFADTAVQQDQNAGYLDFTTTTYSISPSNMTYIYGVAPASSTTWLAAHPGCQYVVLPNRCKGFMFNAFGADMIVNCPEDLATGTYFVGTKVASGTVFKWESRNPDQSKLNLAILSNGAVATATFCAWGQ